LQKTQTLNADFLSKILIIFAKNRLWRDLRLKRFKRMEKDPYWHILDGIF